MAESEIRKHARDMANLYLRAKATGDPQLTSIASDAMIAGLEAEAALAKMSMAEMLIAVGLKELER